MKRTDSTSVLVVAALLALLLSGCDRTSEPSTSTNEGELSAAPGFDPAKKAIRVGVVTATSGPLATVGNPLANGAKAWFDYLNQERGGIGGTYRVELRTEDSQYKPDLGVQAYNSLKNDVALFAQVLGASVVDAMLPAVQKDGLVVSPASPDGRWVHEANLLPVGEPYEVQLINAIDYLLEERGMGGKVFCAMVQDDADGKAGERGIAYTAKGQGFNLKTTAKFSPGAPDLTAQVLQTKAAACQVVLLVASPPDTRKLMETSSQLQFKPQWVGASPGWTPNLAKAPVAPYVQSNLLLAAEGTEWGDMSVKGMTDLIIRVQKYSPSQAPDIHFVFGYSQARAVTALLEKAVALGDLSRTGIRTALTQMDKVSFDGLAGDYQYGAPDHRNPPRATTIFKPDPAKPGGLTKARNLYESELAQTYSFKTS